VTRKRRVIVTIVGVAALAAVLVGAGTAGWATAHRAPDYANPDHAYIVVTRIQPPSGGQSIVFDQQVGDVASHIYAQLVSGAHIPEGAVMSCPAMSVTAPYYRYDLTFSHLGIQTVVATGDALGCQVLDLTYPGGGHEYYSWQALDGTSFWDALHQLVNAPLPI
jgi:hypothetical protein